MRPRAGDKDGSRALRTSTGPHAVRVIRHRSSPERGHTENNRQIEHTMLLREAIGADLRAEARVGKGRG